jgi:hypothetical protein
VRFKLWKLPKDPVETRLLIVIIVLLILYIAFWVLRFLGFFPQFDKPQGR